MHRSVPSSVYRTSPSRKPAQPYARSSARRLTNRPQPAGRSDEQLPVGNGKGAEGVVVETIFSEECELRTRRDHAGRPVFARRVDLPGGEDQRRAIGTWRQPQGTVHRLSRGELEAMHDAPVV